MLSQVPTDPVEVVKYGLWNQEKPEFGEYVELRDVAAQRSVRVTLDRSINGGRPDPGATVVALFDGRVWEDAVEGRNGNKPYIKRQLKLRVVGFQAAA